MQGDRGGEDGWGGGGSSGEEADSLNVKSPDRWITHDDGHPAHNIIASGR